MKLEYSLTLYTKTNSKWITELRIRLDTIKLLKENRGGILFYINHSNIFWFIFYNNEYKSKNQQMRPNWT